MGTTKFDTLYFLVLNQECNLELLLFDMWVGKDNEMTYSSAWNMIVIFP